MKISTEYDGSKFIEVKGEVKPCPFCGGTDLVISSERQFKELYEKHGGATITLECPACNVIKYEHSYSGKNYKTKVNILLDAWNERRMSDGIEEDQQ